jgi:O-acetylserine/cysteine efflux transporter
MLRYLRHAVPDGFTTNLVRYPISTLLYIPLIVAVVRRQSLGTFWKAALLPAAVNIVGQTLFAVSLYHMEAGMMSLLVRISVVWSILGAFLLFPDERRLARLPRFWLGAVLAVAGFVLMAFIGQDAAEVSGLGKLIVFMCSIFWGLYDITVRWTMRDLHPLVVFGVIGNYTSIGLILMAPLGEPASVLRLTAGDATLLVVSAFVGIAAAHGMYYVAIQRLGVAVSAITLLFTPFVSTVGEWMYLDEGMTPLQWAGGVILVLGAATALLARQRVARPSAPPIETSLD